MGEHILAGNPPVYIQLRRSDRARRISLRVSGLDGRVTLTMPRRVPEREALDFAHSKADWIRKHLKSTAESQLVGVGQEIPFQGQNVLIDCSPKRGATFDGTRLWVQGPPERAAARVKAWLKVEARQKLAVASDFYAAELGKPYGRITLRDTRSRWGSCSSRGDLMYSWRLIMAPPDVLDYVVAHEVAHLQEMNHSRAFWSVVAQLCPDYKRHRKWLRDHGNRLHQYRFST